MVYFFKNTILNDSSFLYISISNIKGLGFNRALNLNSSLGLQKNIKVKHLNTYHFTIYSSLININYNTDTFLLKLRERKIKNFLPNSYKGLKYSMNLPIRGQCTKTNAKTAKKRKKN